ncbi:hypothetical protein BCU68_02285 [Vibrio sp. 10N.286.49.B3]|uniref:DUF1840 domain-containing protein n=1 Tax=Vibrio sp. 10N.286.49.B3 TaxID=1880855 RepID=UPI000C848A75|nr:DUF1840 domain-containing protein [Vibrio sp. 10N.286.49.B3]PMH46224.1 hypothetical protein BCU68_02285 [Vibrio sp. 10N.286.49.B3]
MLITFKAKSCGNVMMFGDVGLLMLKMMGHSKTVPGAIIAADVPAALAQLQAAIEQEVRCQQAEETQNDDGEEEECIQPSVGLNQRAFPLLALLKKAVQENNDVMWESLE